MTNFDAFILILLFLILVFGRKILIYFLRFISILVVGHFEIFTPMYSRGNLSEIAEAMQIDGETPFRINLYVLNSWMREAMKLNLPRWTSRKVIQPPHTESDDIHPDACPNCNLINDEEMKFCGNCGTKL